MPKKRNAGSTIDSYSKSVTLKDISQKVGVSIGTVDRALNNRGRIKSETKTAVLAAAKELHYQRNEFARALRKRSEIRILAIYPKDVFGYNEFFTTGLGEEAERLSNYGLKLDIIRTLSLDPTDILKVTEQLDIKSYNGILLNAGGPELDDFIDSACAAGIPVVTFNSDSPRSQRAFFCGEDHYCAGRLCGELVAKLLRGEGSVAFFSGIPTVHALKERLRGFRDILQEAYPGVHCVQSISHNDSTDQIVEKAEKLLFETGLPDAVFCNSASGVVPICKVLEQRRPKYAPIVVGYDYSPEIEHMLECGLCSAVMFQNPRGQARNALRFMFQHLYDGTPFPNAEEGIIIPTIILRNNVGVCTL